MKQRIFKAKIKKPSTIIDCEVERNDQYEQAEKRAKERFRLDQLIFKEIGLCSFIRPCVEGELEGFDLPNNIDASAIKYVYVLRPSSLDHVKEHMKPLPTHLGAVMFDSIGEKRVHARILLTEEHMEIIKMSMNKAEMGLFMDGKAVK